MNVKLKRRGGWHGRRAGCHDIAEKNREVIKLDTFAYIYGVTCPFKCAAPLRRPFSSGKSKNDQNLYMYRFCAEAQLNIIFF